MNLCEKDSKETDQRIRPRETSINKLESILQSNNRTIEEAAYMYYKIKHMSFFKRFISEEEDGFDYEGYIQCCQNLKYEVRNPGDVILHQGEPSNEKMYIVFSGELAAVTSNHIQSESTEDKRPQYTQKHNEMKIDIELLEKLDSPISSEEADEVIFTEIDQNQRFNSKAQMVDSQFIEDSPTSLQRKKLIQSVRKSKILFNNMIQQKHNLEKLSPMKLLCQGEMNSYVRAYGQIKDFIQTGGFFGENAILNQGKREATIIALTKCELLIMEKNILLNLRTQYDRKKLRILNFLIQVFPELDQCRDKSIRESYAYIIEEMNLPYGHVICEEESKGEYFYILYTGQCEVYRTIWVDESGKLPYPLSKLKDHYTFVPVKNRKVSICEIGPGKVFGEEIVFNDNSNYEYTVKIKSSSAIVYKVYKPTFTVRFPQKGVVELFEIYKNKKQMYNQMIVKEISQKKIIIDSEDINETLTGHQSVNQDSDCNKTRRGRNSVVGLLKYDITKANADQQINFSANNVTNSNNIIESQVKDQLVKFSRKDFIKKAEQVEYKLNIPFMKLRRPQGTKHVRQSNSPPVFQRWDEFYDYSLKKDQREGRIYKQGKIDKDNIKKLKLTFHHQEKKPSLQQLPLLTAERCLAQNSKSSFLTTRSITQKLKQELSQELDLSVSDLLSQSSNARSPTLFSLQLRRIVAKFEKEKSQNRDGANISLNKLINEDELLKKSQIVHRYKVIPKEIRKEQKKTCVRIDNSGIDLKGKPFKVIVNLQQTIEIYV